MISLNDVFDSSLPVGMATGIANSVAISWAVMLPSCLSSCGVEMIEITDPWHAVCVSFFCEMALRNLKWICKGDFLAANIFRGCAYLQLFCKSGLGSLVLAWSALVDSGGTWPGVARPSLAARGQAKLSLASLGVARPGQARLASLAGSLSWPLAKPLIELMPQPPA